MADTKKKTIKAVKPVEVEKVVEAPVEEKAVELSPKEQAKMEIYKQMLNDGELTEVKFVKTRVPRSDFFADFYNKQPKVIAVWPTEDGEVAGVAEPVRRNGAVAWIPKGRPVLVPEVVAQSFKGYLAKEQNVGEDMPNNRGGIGIKVENDEALKKALDL